MRRVFNAFLGITAVIVVLLFLHVGHYLFVGMAYIPTVENRWWAGYYDTTSLGRQWCLAVFEQSRAGRVRLILISGIGTPLVFTGDRRSSDATFVTFDLKDTSGLTRIQAKQLYEGKRYMLQRLLAGRFGDFWERNEDVSIRGQFVLASGATEFAIQELPPDRVDAFWRHDVQRVDGREPRDLVLSSGFALPPTSPRN